MTALTRCQTEFLRKLAPLWDRARNSPVANRLAIGTFWTVGGAICSRLAGVVGSVIVARLLGKITFGELGIVQSTVGLFATFAGLGIGITATKYVAEFRTTKKEQCGRVIGFSLAAAAAGGILTAGLMLILARWLAIHTLSAEQLTASLKIGAGMVLLGALQGAYTGALSGFEAFRSVARVNWISGLVGVPLVVLGAWGLGLEGAIWGIVLQSGVACLIGHYCLAKQMEVAGVHFSFSLTAEELRLLWRFTLPAFASAMLAAPAGWVTRTLLVRQPGGYAEAALVSAANQWMNLLTFLPWMMGGVLVPILSSLYAEGQLAKYQRLLRLSLLLNAAFGLVLVVPLVLFSGRILSFYGPGFSEGINIFNLAMLAGLFIAFNSLLSRALQSAGLAWVELSSNAIWAFTVVAGSWLLVPRGRGLGLVAAHTLAAIGLSVWQWNRLRQLTREPAIQPGPTQTTPEVQCP